MPKSNVEDKPFWHFVVFFLAKCRDMWLNHSGRKYISFVFDITDECDCP